MPGPTKLAPLTSTPEPKTATADAFAAVAAAQHFGDRSADHQARLAKVDAVDVSTMTGGEATRLLEARAANARRLTFDRTLPPLPNYNHGA